MTPEEKERLSKFSFDELWNDLWIYKDFEIYKHHHTRAKKRFETISSRIPEFIKKTKSSVCTTLSWGFPKGKTENNESARECALREFKEEVNIYRSQKMFPCFDYSIEMWNMGPLMEMFCGTDGRMYVTYYFLATCKNEFVLSRIKPVDSVRGETLSEEANDAKWVSFSKAGSYLCSTHMALLNVVKNILEL
jgi:ADP-ribose pyrophosphatase YjhB (NUDIX family)